MIEAPETIHLEVRWQVKALYLLAIFYFFWLLYRMWQHDLPIFIVINLFLGLGSLWLFFLSFTKVDANSTSIKVTVPHGVYEMNWDEVISVEIIKKTTLFFGENKAIGYNLLFGAKGKAEFQEYISRIVDQHQFSWGRPTLLNDNEVQKLIKKSKVGKGILF